jgi:hypothetical protein
MAKYIIKKDGQGNKRKINIIISEHQEEDGVFVSKINPDIYIPDNTKSYEEDLSCAIALFERSLNFKEEERFVDP